MHWFDELLRRLSMLVHRRQFDADLEEEMRLHLELRQGDAVESGAAPGDARAAARRRFGNTTYLKEESHLAWGWEWLENLAQDVRYGLRVVRKSPGFSAVAILTIALGIGATTAIFSIVDATLVHPLPYPEPEQLVNIEDDLPGIGARDVGMSVPEWHDLQLSGIFEYVSPVGGGDVNLTGASQPERIRFLNVAPNYFALLGVKAQLGRTFNPDDNTPGFNLEALISDGLWKRAFAGDPAILGKNLRLDNDMYHVVGVMPPGFHDPGRTNEERNIEIWLASGFAAPPAPDPRRSLRVLQGQGVIGRIKSNLTIAQAQSRVDALAAFLQQQFPADYPAQSAWTVRLIPLKETVVGNVRQSLILLLAAVGLVLLIGCVNVANLLLARASARGREMAVRQALGAGRKRLVAQLLTENLCLAIIGGFVGLTILFCTQAFLVQIVPDSLPRLTEISINWTVLLFAAAASLAAGAIFGLAPALQTGRFDLTRSLREAARGSTGSGDQARTRRLLVITEFALSLVLMIAAGLLLRSFWDLLSVRPGFNPQDVMAVRVWLPIPNDPNTDPYRTAAQEAPFVRELLRRGRTLPGVEEIAIGDVAALPLGHARDDLNPYPVILEGRDITRNQAPLVNASIVTPEYFHLLDVPILHGRSFTDADTDQTPGVTVINEAFARTYWPNVDPLGRRLQLPAPGDRSSLSWATVIGVVADARTESLTETPVPQLYLSLYQRRAKDLAIFVRGRLDAAATPVELREQVQAVDPQLPVFGAQTLNDALSESLSQRRFAMQIVGLFALTALLLAGLGIYGVLSYIVSERTHEIGIRLALGASGTSMLQMVFRQGLVLATSGAAIGLVGALVISQLMAGLLYGVRPTDPLTFLGVTLLLVLVALSASVVPAYRAIRVDPMVALRHE